MAVVRENTAGALNNWLEEEGYQRIEDGEDITDFYREKGYVFACIKVDNAQLQSDAPADLHPLRFSFLTGGRDGILTAKGPPRSQFIRHLNKGGTGNEHERDRKHTGG